MSLVASTAPRLDIGQALQDVLNVFRRNLGPLALLATLAYVPISLVHWGAVLGAQNPVFGLFTLAGVVTFFICRPILFGAVIFLTVRKLDGHPMKIRECWDVGRRRWGTMLALTIWSGLLVGLGFIFLIVPGVFLLVQWAVSGPALVLSGRGVSGSMDESVRLTKGRRWSILLFYLVVMGGLVVIWLLLGIVESILAMSGPKVLMTGLTEPLGSVLFDVCVPLIAAVLYRRLRGDADSAPTAALAEVFA